MNQDERPHLETIGTARKAIVEQLRREWPYPLTITPQNIAERVSDRVFIEAAKGLQEEGLIMYEALLIGAGPAPQLLDAALTRRGQLLESDPR